MSRFGLTIVIISGYRPLGQIDMRQAKASLDVRACAHPSRRPGQYMSIPVSPTATTLGWANQSLELGTGVASASAWPVQRHCGRLADPIGRAGDPARGLRSSATRDHRGHAGCGGSLDERPHRRLGAPHASRWCGRRPTLGSSGWISSGWAVGATRHTIGWRRNEALLRHHRDRISQRCTPRRSRLRIHRHRRDARFKRPMARRALPDRDRRAWLEGVRSPRQRAHCGTPAYLTVSAHAGGAGTPFDRFIRTNDADHSRGV